MPFPPASELSLASTSVPVSIKIRWRAGSKRGAPRLFATAMQSAPRSRGTQRADRERRGAARSDSYDNVVFIKLSIGDCFRPFCFVVFGALNALQYRSAALQPLRKRYGRLANRMLDQALRRPE